MTLEEAYLVVYDRIQAEFQSTTDPVQVVYMDDKSETRDSNEYMQVDFVPLAGGQDSIGGCRFRTEGRLIVQVKTKLGLFATRNMQLQERALNTLRKYRSGSLRFWNGTPTPLGNTDDGYFTSMVTFEFQYRTVVT